MHKTFCAIAADTYLGWIGVAEVDDVPTCFGVFQDATPAFVPERSFIARAFYHKPGEQMVTQTLLSFFERWAHEEGIKRMIVTTRRDSGAAIRCFESKKYGFSRGYITFEKEIK